MAFFFSFKSTVEKRREKAGHKAAAPFPETRQFPLLFLSPGAGTRPIFRTSAAICCHPCKQLPPSGATGEPRQRGKNSNWEGAFARCWSVSSVSYPAAPGRSSSKRSPAVPASQRRMRPLRRSRNHTQDSSARKLWGILNALCVWDSAPSHQGSALFPALMGARSQRFSDKTYSA